VPVTRRRALALLAAVAALRWRRAAAVVARDKWIGHC
jgi:hypothetical protein